MSVLWAVNPRRRKRKLSAKQLAAGFGGKKQRRAKRGKRRGRKRGRAVATAAPVIRRRRRGKAMRRARRGGRRSRSFLPRSGSMMNLLKSGAVGGAGAIAVDLAMGQVVNVLPDNMRSPMTATGEANLGYFGTKLALALALGTYGRNIPFIGRYATDMSVGSITVMAHQFMRPIAMQAGAKLGAYFSPAPLQRPRQLSRVGNAGAYMSPLRRETNGGVGARASNVMNMVKVAQRAA